MKGSAKIFRFMFLCMIGVCWGFPSVHADFENANDRVEFVDALSKYSSNPFRINPLSYAIYQKDYRAATCLLENGVAPSVCEVIHTYSCPRGVEPTYHFTSLDFLFVDEVVGIKYDARFVVPRPYCSGYGNKGKITFRLISELETAEQEQIRHLLYKLIKKQSQVGSASLLHGHVIGVGVTGTQGLHREVELREELIKLGWNELFTPSGSFDLNMAMVYDNSEIFVSALKKCGRGSIEASLNFAVKKLLGKDVNSPDYEEVKAKWVNYIIRLLGNGASPDATANDGHKPVDIVQKYSDSDTKREIISLFIDYGAFSG